MTADPGSPLPVAFRAIDTVSEIIRTQPLSTLTEKSDRGLVSDVDLAVERAIRAHLKNETPGIGFLGEEEGRTGTPGAWTPASPSAIAHAETLIADEEASAAPTATAAAYLHEAATACRESVRTLTIISRHGTAALRSYLASEYLESQVTEVIARDREPQRVPELLKRAFTALVRQQRVAICCWRCCGGIRGHGDVAGRPLAS